jgi:hypothetical protein
LILVLTAARRGNFSSPPKRRTAYATIPAAKVNTVAGSDVKSVSRYRTTQNGDINVDSATIILL